MSSSSKITLKLSAAPGEQDKRAPLDDFSNICGALRNCLKHIARCLGKENVSFVISNLEYGSACLEAEPEVSADDDIADVFNGTIAAIEDGREVDPRLDYPAVYCFTGFNGAVRNKQVVLDCNHRSLTPQYVANLSDLLEPTSPALGSVSGRLEVVNIHNESKFTLYPPVPGEEIICKFEESDLEEVLRAVKGRHQVTVFGKLHYAKSKAFPARVDVESFDIEPNDDDLPTLLDAKGILHLPTDTQAPLGGEWVSGWH